MNLLFVSEYFYPRNAGGEVWSWELCKALAKKMNVTVITLRFDDSPTEEKIEGVQIFRPYKNGKGRFARRRASRRLARYVRKYVTNNKVDVIHVNAFTLNVPVSRIAKANGIPCITSIHSYFGDVWNSLSPLGWFYRRLEKKFIIRDRSTTMHVPSKQMQERIKKEIGKETTIIEHWAPESFPRPKKLPKETYLYVGSLEKVKNPLACIPASKGKTLVIIGQGSLEKKMKDAARKLDCTFIKSATREETLAYIGGASLVLVPSLTESFSLVALEAVASGTPVSGTPVGILPELPGVVPFPPKKTPARLPKKQVLAVRKKYAKSVAIQRFMQLYKEVQQ